MLQIKAFANNKKVEDWLDAAFSIVNGDFENVLQVDFEVPV
jgi:hypothetical protein